MKKLLLIVLFALVGCQQLQHGQEQPVVKKNAIEELYFTTCAGAVEMWSDCYAKAQRTCPSGYKVISIGDNNQGTQRDLTFQCKK